MNLSEKRPTGTDQIWQMATEWVSRVMAIGLLMVLPGVLGAWLDKKFGTSFLTLLGFAIGLLAGLSGLILIARRLTPPARGKPLPAEEPETQIDNDKLA